MAIFSRHRSSTPCTYARCTKKQKTKRKKKNHRGRQATPLKSWRFWRVRGYVLPSGRSARLVERVETATQAGRPDDDGDGRAWLRQVINHHHLHHLSKNTHRSSIIRQVIGFLSAPSPHVSPCPAAAVRICIILPVPW